MNDNDDDQLDLSTWQSAIHHTCPKCKATPGQNCLAINGQHRRSHHRERYKQLRSDPIHMTTHTLHNLRAAFQAALNTHQPDQVVTDLATAMDHLEAALGTMANTTSEPPF